MIYVIKTITSRRDKLISKVKQLKEDIDKLDRALSLLQHDDIIEDKLDVIEDVREVDVEVKEAVDVIEDNDVIEEDKTSKDDKLNNKVIVCLYEKTRDSYASQFDNITVINVNNNPNFSSIMNDLIKNGIPIEIYDDSVNEEGKQVLEGIKKYL